MACDVKFSLSQAGNDVVVAAVAAASENELVVLELVPTSTLLRRFE